MLPPAAPDAPVLEADRGSLALRRTWARLIRKVYEVDPLTCPRCGGPMKVIAVIEDEEVISRSAELATKPDPLPPRVPRGWLRGTAPGARPEGHSPAPPPRPAPGPGS